MSFTQTPVPGQMPKETQRFLREEFRRIEIAFLDLDNLKLPSLAAEPEKLADGMVVYADGTNWNPGSGAGFYGRESSAWVKL